jgi:hypothetical protein
MRTIDKGRLEECMKKIAVLIGLMVVLFSAGVSQGWNTVHGYLNGKVNSVHDNRVVIGDRELVIEEKCRVVIVSKDNGIFHENPAHIRDMRTGDTVTVKVIANTISEIMIERWR